MITTAVRLARVGSPVELTAAVVLLGGFPCMLVAALLPSLWLFAAVAAATYVADFVLHQHGSRLVKLLSRVRAGVSIRFLTRQLLLVLLTSRMGQSDTAVFYLGTASFLLFYGLQAPHGAALTLIRNRRRLPVVTRNIDLAGLRIPDAPPAFLTNRAAEKMLHLDLPVVVGLVITSATGEGAFGLVGIGTTLVLAALCVLSLLPWLRGSRSPEGPDRVLAFTDAWLREYKPQTVLYFSGSRTSAYQVNMWLETMARLRTRPLVILRERYIVPQLAPASVPVLCVPSATHLMNMDLSTVRVALYPANVGKNIHLLRVPSVQHVFVGHGDSDKLASVNPYSKAYDEVWTAGRAGRDRYALADVGVRDEDIAEVGRPQLESILPGTGTPAGPVPTVLYAPTWEGWTDDPGNTSLILAGENIVRKLVEASPGVRVLYKPHPFTGTRSPKAKAAHERVLALLERANAERAASPEWAGRTAEGADTREAAAAELRRVSARLAELEQAAKEDADEAEGSRDGVADPDRAEEADALRTQWNEVYWTSQAWWEHQGGHRFPAASVRLLQPQRHDGLGHIERGVRLHRQRQAVRDRRHGRSGHRGVQAAELDGPRGVHPHPGRRAAPGAAGGAARGGARRARGRQDQAQALSARPRRAAVDRALRQGGHPSHGQGRRAAGAAGLLGRGGRRGGGPRRRGAAAA